jgi:hypothetical protein
MIYLKENNWLLSQVKVKEKKYGAVGISFVKFDAMWKLESMLSNSEQYGHIL